MRRIKEALHEKRYNQQQRRYYAIFPYLSQAQISELDAHATVLENQNPRRWWVIAYPDSRPPSKLRAVWLGIKVVGTFLILSTAVDEVLIATGLLVGASYHVIFPAYLLLAAPMAVIAIANLAAQLHLLPRRALERA